jgi:hypothetical protein
MKPIVLWLTGILGLVILLVVRGGFQRPLIYTVVGVMAVGLLVGFIVAFKRKKQ